MQKVTLFITPAENRPGEYLVVVNGEGFHGSVNAEVGARVRGEDEWFDDRLFSMGFPGLSRVGVDGTFTLSEIVPGSTLNEDWGQDEIYALVKVKGLSGEFRSNTIQGHF